MKKETFEKAKLVGMGATAVGASLACGRILRSAANQADGLIVKIILSMGCAGLSLVAANEASKALGNWLDEMSECGIFTIEDENTEE